MSAPPDEIRTLTGVRAYAAVWVMLLHLPFSIGVAPHVNVGEVARHGAWGVDVFFVLSGFILSLLYAPRFCTQGLRAVYRNYLAARIARIYPLHVAALAALAAYYLPRALMTGRVDPGFTPGDLGLNLALVHAWGYADRLNWNFPSWSISCEWFAYLLLTPLFALSLRRVHAVACLGLAFVAWTALYAAIHGVGQGIHEQTVSWSVPRIFAEFLLGYALYRLYANFRPTPWLADSMVVGGVAAMVALCYLPPAAEWFLAPVVAVLVLGLARAGPAGRAVFGHRWAVFWGERSYSIYMLHAVVQIYGNLALKHLGIGALAPAQAWGLFFVQCAAVLLTSHLAYGVIELPMRRRLRALLERRAPPAPTGAAPVAVS